ncbi:MAG TPA: peptidylprolyl isomerase [Thermoanaerobaculia bacterium]|nr:peptidylprolyl isomerase [Thermoanaerobaculia bacterium]
MRAPHRLAAAVVAGLFAAGCQASPPEVVPERVATIDSEEVRWEEFAAYLERQLGESGDSLGSEVLSELFDQFLAERLLLRLAAERGLLSGQAPTGRAAVRRRAVDRLLAEDAGERRPPTAEEIASFYAAHRAEFARPERVRLQQILVADRATAEAALAEVRGGADFVALGERLAADPALGAESGDQGELAREDLPPAFAEPIFSLAPGEVSEVVTADYGYHLFQVVERLPAEVVPLAEARDEIERRLRQQQADRRLVELVEEAHRRYDVSVHDRNLPFNYRGRYLEG